MRFVSVAGAILAFASCLTPLSARAGWVSDYVELNGGCQGQLPQFRQTIELEESNVRDARPIGPIMGKNASDWSSDDVWEAAEVMANCTSQIQGGDPSEHLEPFLDDLYGIVEMARRDPAKVFGSNFYTPSILPPGASIATEVDLLDAQRRQALEQADIEQQNLEEAQSEIDQARAALEEARAEAERVEAERVAAERELQSLNEQHQLSSFEAAAGERAIAQIESQQFSSLNPAGSCAITFEQFSEVKIGMSYDKVRRLVGCDGVAIGEERIGQYRMESYRWNGGPLSGVLAVFENGRLVSKVQSGLR